MIRSFVVFILAAALIAVIDGWITMLLLRNLHDYVNPSIAAAGFWPGSVVIGVLATALVGAGARAGSR